MMLVLETGSGTERVEIFVEGDHTIPRKGERIVWEERRSLDGIEPGTYVVRDVLWRFAWGGGPGEVTLRLEAD